MASLRNSRYSFTAYLSGLLLFILGTSEAQITDIASPAEDESPTGDASDTSSSSPAFFHAGLAFEQFPPVWNPEGSRTEIAGPFFYKESGSEESITAFPPWFSKIQYHLADGVEWDVLYPLMTYSRYGEERRWQFLQWLNFATGDTQESVMKRRYNLFPILFFQRSENPENNYSAVFPIYGTMKNRLLRKRIRFVLFPLYGESEKSDFITYNYLYPIYHWRRGPATFGWQVWPLVGWERKGTRQVADTWGDEVTDPGYQKFSLIWPLFFHNNLDLGTENPIQERIFLPFYKIERSPLRDSYTIPWPLFTYTNDREDEYKEVGAPWPLIVRAWGEGKQTTRVWPFFSRSKSAELKSNFYAWPIYKYNETRAEPLLRQRTRILFFLFSNLKETNMPKQTTSRRIDLWPLFQWKKEYDGRTRFQLLAPIEVFTPENPSIERNYSHIWSLWKSEKGELPSNWSRSLLWNLYREQSYNGEMKRSFLFGLIQRTSSSEEVRWKWLHLFRSVRSRN